MNGPDCRLIVLAKQPQPGRVKTRLCPPYSPVQAAEIAQAAIADTLAAVLAAVPKARALGHVVEPVLVLDGDADPWLHQLLEWPVQLRVLAQRPGGLDARIAGAFEDATIGSVSRCAVLVGMDTPQVTDALLVEAIDRLKSPGCDAVLGHAQDGGWWAMGLREPDPALMLGIPMSTARTGRAQLRRLEAAGLSVGLLPCLRDVDTAADVRHVAARAPRTRLAATVARLDRAGIPSP